MTFLADQYQLLDFGGGEKIERFADLVVRRTTPSVSNRKGRNRDFDADLHYQECQGEKGWVGTAPDNWQVRHGNKVFNLRPTPAGQVGLFPEQATVWEWIERQATAIRNLRALNLFAYTGGTTQTLANSGADVVHVDAAQNVIKWAKQNYSDGGNDPNRVRWICDDALKFSQREIRRGSKYDILIADPPSYGKGPKRETWKFKRDIEQLIECFEALASDEIKLIVITSHTPGIDSKLLKELIRIHFKRAKGRVVDRKLYLKAASGERLFSGSCGMFISDQLNESTL